MLSMVHLDDRGAALLWQRHYGLGARHHVTQLPIAGDGDARASALAVLLDGSNCSSDQATSGEKLPGWGWGSTAVVGASTTPGMA